MKVNKRAMILLLRMMKNKKLATTSYYIESFCLVMCSRSTTVDTCLQKQESAKNIGMKSSY